MKNKKNLSSSEHSYLQKYEKVPETKNAVLISATFNKALGGSLSSSTPSPITPSPVSRSNQDQNLSQKKEKEKKMWNSSPRKINPEFGLDYNKNQQQNARKQKAPTIPLAPQQVSHKFLGPESESKKSRVELNDDKNVKIGDDLGTYSENYLKKRGLRIDKKKDKESYSRQQKPESRDSLKHYMQSNNGKWKIKNGQKELTKPAEMSLSKYLSQQANQNMIKEENTFQIEQNFQQSAIEEDSRIVPQECSYLTETPQKEAAPWKKEEQPSKNILSEEKPQQKQSNQEKRQQGRELKMSQQASQQFDQISEISLINEKKISESSDEIDFQLGLMKNQPEDKPEDILPKEMNFLKNKILSQPHEGNSDNQNVNGKQPVQLQPPAPSKPLAQSVQYRPSAFDKPIAHSAQYVHSSQPASPLQADERLEGKPQAQSKKPKKLQRFLSLNQPSLNEPVRKKWEKADIESYNPGILNNPFVLSDKKNKLLSQEKEAERERQMQRERERQLERERERAQKRSERFADEEDGDETRSFIIDEDGNLIERIEVEIKDCGYCQLMIVGEEDEDYYQPQIY